MEIVRFVILVVHVTRHFSDILIFKDLKLNLELNQTGLGWL